MHLEKKASESKGEDRNTLQTAIRAFTSQIDIDENFEVEAKPRTKQKRRMSFKDYWTNVSVQALAGPNPKGDSPIKLVTRLARDLIFEYLQEGGSTEPVDPFDLARHRDLKVEPSASISDARTVHVGGGRLLIQYNPNQSLVRSRFSLCHEIVHTMFPDCREMVRNRSTHERMELDEWQLESLCDIGAAELLMPIGTFKELEKQPLSIDPLLKLRDRLKVSTEALLLRTVKLTETPCFVFSASLADYRKARYKIDYSYGSRTFHGKLPYGWKLSGDSVVSNCIRLGFTDKAYESWYPPLGDLRIECVAVSPYPGTTHARVMGIAIPSQREDVAIDSIHYVKGNAMKPRGREHRIIAQIVNDRAPMWGGGFALALRRTWPEVQKNFFSWATAEPSHLRLGSGHLSSVDDRTDVFSMICQHGYKPTPKPSIRYNALRTCLESLATVAMKRNATVHMPRIGCGQAGGNWDVVSEMVTHFLCERGIRVTVYDLPGTEYVEKEPTLFSLE